jgi:hypothetical protein
VHLYFEDETEQRMVADLMSNDGRLRVLRFISDMARVTGPLIAMNDKGTLPSLRTGPNSPLKVRSRYRRDWRVSMVLRTISVRANELRQTCAAMLVFCSTTALSCLVIQSADAGQCVITGPQYHLQSDIVEWRLRTRVGASCVHDIPRGGVLSELIKIISPPSIGELSAKGPTFSYTAGTENDAFSIEVSGLSNGRTGTSTVRVLVSIIKDPPTQGALNSSAGGSGSGGSGGGSAPISTQAASVTNVPGEPVNATSNGGGVPGSGTSAKGGSTTSADPSTASWIDTGSWIGTGPSHGNNDGVHGVPGPIAGAGFPIIAVGYGAYWLVRRYRRKSTTPSE